MTGVSFGAGGSTSCLRPCFFFHFSLLLTCLISGAKTISCGKRSQLQYKLTVQVQVNIIFVSFTVHLFIFMVNTRFLYQNERNLKKLTNHLTLKVGARGFLIYVHNNSLQENNPKKITLPACYLTEINQCVINVK